MPFLFGEPHQRSRWWQRAWLTALFIAGAITWAYVMGFGRLALDFHDWADITIPRLTFLQGSLQRHELPLHVERTNALHGVTGRFLAIPDVITTPQTLLLLLMPVNAFVLVDVLIHYTIGFGGLLLLRRYFNWSLFAFSSVFLLVLFNGHILAHYSVGHLTWGAYFLFPIVALLLCRILDGDTSWRVVAMFAGTMFYMLLAGGEHHVTWVLLLVAALAVVSRRHTRTCLALIAATVLLGAVRLLPPGLELASFRQAGFGTDVHGYPSLLHLLESLVYLRRETHLPVGALPANLVFFDQRFWEYNVYVGVPGAALMAIGLWQWGKNGAARYRDLIVPMIALTALSMGSLFRLLQFSGLPLLLGERATSRMFGFVLVLLIIIACTAIDKWIRGASHPWLRTRVAVPCLAFASLDMAGSIRLQRVAISSGMFGPGAFNPSNPAHYADPVYSTVLLIGLVISSVSAITLVVLAWRERRT